MEMPLSSTHARLPHDRDRATELRAGRHAYLADHPTDPAGSSAGPSPLDLMTGSLAACTAMSARSFLERDGDPGDIEVTVTLDAGPPTWLHRRVVLTRRLAAEEEPRLVAALERTELTMMLRPALRIRTSVEYGEPSAP